MKKFILSIDQGTTGSTALIINKETLEVVAKKTMNSNKSIQNQAG